MSWIRELGWKLWGAILTPIVLLLVIFGVRRRATKVGMATGEYEAEKKAIERADRDELHRRLTEKLK